jgi:hypothetical protein
LGVTFGNHIPQRIHVLTGPPQYPGAPGSPRAVAANDAPLLFEWLLAFHREAVPHDPPPKQENIGKAVTSGRYVFWVVGDEPVSVAAIARPLRTVVALAPVYTPPQHRGRGYGDADMGVRLPQLSLIARLQRERLRSAYTPTSATPPPIAAMPGSASGPIATPRTISVLANRTRNKKLGLSGAVARGAMMRTQSPPLHPPMEPLQAARHAEKPLLL